MIDKIVNITMTIYERVTDFGINIIDKGCSLLDKITEMFVD